MTVYDHKRFAILYVDDENKMLKNFERAFKDEFSILTAESVKEANEVLLREDVRVGVVLTDQRMPEEQGLDLLMRLKRDEPRIVRILTTAYTSMDNAVAAVNEGGIFQYVAKPWTLDGLRVVLRSAMEFFLVQRERDDLLTEKLSVLQRVILSDRLRSLALLTTALSSRLRNAPATLYQYMIDAPPCVWEARFGQVIDWGDLWGIANRDAQRQINVMQAVLSGLRASADFTHDGDLAELAERHTSMAKGWVRGIGINIDESVFASLFLNLDAVIRAVSDPESITFDLVGTESMAMVRMSLPTQLDESKLTSLYGCIAGSELPNDGPGAAFFSTCMAAGHHGGNVRIDRENQSIVLKLARDPTNTTPHELDDAWLEGLFEYIEEHAPVSINVETR